MMRRRNLRVTEQLIGELEAERFDSPLTKRILENPGSFPRLLRACFLAQTGKYSAARADVRAALEWAPDNPVVELVAGMISFATRDYQRAIDHYERVAAGGGPAAHRARQQIIDAARALGWEHDVRRALADAIAAEPNDPSWHAQAARFYARGCHWTRALEHARRALELAPASPRMWMEAANLHARLDQREPALAALARALELAPADEELIYRREAARVAIDASDYGLALACLERALQLEPAAAELVQIAEIHSWKGDDAEASAATARALALDPGCAAAIRMQGALQVRAKRYEQAIETLRRAVALEPTDYQAHVWLSEAYLRLERFEAGHAQLHHGTMNAGGFLFVAWLLRFLLVSYESGDPSEILTPNRTEELDAVLRELCPEQAERGLATMQTSDLLVAVEAALAALRGNRSIYATHVVDGSLTRLHARTGCRHESRWALQLLRVAPGEECLRYFDDIFAKYPGSSLPICHRGELHLWLGNFDAARADLEAAIQTVEGTRWAYIGLSTLDLLAGDPQAALDTNAHGVRVMQNTEGPAVYVFRGEAMRKLGRIDAAIVELEKSVAHHPARASGTINLALCYASKADQPRFDALWKRLRDEQAAGLLSDAAHELDLTIFGDDDWEPELEVKVAVLEHALTMMGGNRSSGLLTYWTRAKTMRFVRLWPHVGVSAHARDRAHLDQAKRVLLKALAHYQGPRAV